MKNELGWKVPFRQVYCDTFGAWLKATAWCHLVIRIYPNASDPGGPPREYPNPPTTSAEPKAA